MPLTDCELTTIKCELGHNLLAAGAEPYIGTTQLFEQVIQRFLLEGADTTSSTTVIAAGSPTFVTVTLDDPTGFSAGDKAVIDVDSFQESATIRSISGSDIELALTGGHSGTYPVTVCGGLTIVRDVLSKISDAKEQLSQNYGAGSLKKVDEIEFYGTGGKTYFGALGDNLKFWRNQLASYLGVDNLFEYRQSCGLEMSMY